jgi:hypothetical protein
VHGAPDDGAILDYRDHHTVNAATRCEVITTPCKAFWRHVEAAAVLYELEAATRALYKRGYERTKEA